MDKGWFIHGSMDRGIVIPGNYINRFGNFPVIISLYQIRKIVGDGEAGVLPYLFFLIFNTGTDTAAHKTHVINVLSLETGHIPPCQLVLFNICEIAGGKYLGKISICMSPKCSIPCSVDSINVLIFPFKPVTEFLCAGRTVAVKMVFVIDVPQFYGRVMPITFC